MDNLAAIFVHGVYVSNVKCMYTRASGHNNWCSDSI